MANGKRPVPTKPMDEEQDDEEEDDDPNDQSDDQDDQDESGDSNDQSDQDDEDEDEMEAEKEALAEAAAKRPMKKAAEPAETVQYLEYDMAQFHADLTDTIKALVAPIVADLGRVRRINAGLRKSLDTMTSQLDEIAGQNETIQKALNVVDGETIVKAIPAEAVVPERTEAAKTEAKPEPAGTEVLEKAVDNAGMGREASRLVEKAVQIRNDHGINVPGLTKDLVFDLNKGIVHPDAVNALRAGLATVEKTLAGA